MNELSKQTPERPGDFAGKIERIAQGFAYPPTPDLAARVSPRPDRKPAPGKLPTGWLPGSRTARVALVLLVLVIMFSTLLSIPPVRAQLLEYLQVGVVRIFFTTPTPVTEGGALPARPGEVPEAQAVVTATPKADTALPGRTTLEQARQAFDDGLSLPTYPPGLGEPDEVYLLQAGTPVAVLVWLEPDDLQTARLSLYVLPPGNIIAKKQIVSATPTTLNGAEAFWIEDPHPLELYDDQGRPFINRYVSQHVLVWFSENLTYRLESNLPLAEAVRVAESIPK